MLPRALIRSLITSAAILFISHSHVISHAIASEPVATIESEHLTFSIERVANNLEHPWAVTRLPDGRYLVSERSGNLILITENGDKQTLPGLPDVSTHGQGGLLDVSLHPRFGEAGGEHDWVYFTWSKPDGQLTRTALSRGKWQGETLTDIELVFEQDRASSPGRHYGSRLAWLPDGTLLMSIGDRGRDPSRAQASDDHAGSTLRLTATGDVPDDNPFIDDTNTLDEIYTQGNRNIQGMIVRENGEPWATEHGPRTGDELNYLQPGKNYGWPEVSRGNDYATNEPIGANTLPGMVDPVYVFTGRFAPSGLAEVTSNDFAPWQGQLLAGGLGSETLIRLALEGQKVTQEEVLLEGQLGRIRDVHQSPKGGIYLLTDESPAALYRLKPQAK